LAVTYRSKSQLSSVSLASQPASQAPRWQVTDLRSGCAQA